MDALTYEIEAALQRDHWWFSTRRLLLSRLLARLSPPLPPDTVSLDVGSGTGSNVPVLSAVSGSVVCLDSSPLPFGFSGVPGVRRVVGDAAAMPFPDNSFDLVVALDVLEHLDDDAAAARELHRVLRPGGVLIVFVPALMIFWGIQDEVGHHRRRYRRKVLAGLIQGAGFRLERLTYFNTLLAAPILAARLMMRLRRPRGIRSENEVGGRWTNRLLKAIFSLEVPWLGRFDLPVGVSLACVARRPS